MISKKRQKVYLMHIEELEKRQTDHEEQIQVFKKEIEKNESRSAHLVSKM